MIFCPKKGKILVFIFFAVFFSAASLFAQPAIEKATSEADRLGQQDIEKLLRKPQLKKEAPPEVAQEQPSVEGETKFFIKKIDLVGCESFPPEDFKPLIDKYRNREVTLTELNILAGEIEKEYLRRGVVAAVFVPAQDIVDDKVTLQVVEAKMGKLEIQPHKYFVNERLRYYWSLRPGQTLRYDKISKSLQIMSRNPDREVTSVLRAGKTPGTTDVILTSKTNFPVHVISTFDNDGVTSSGKSRLNVGVRDNNFLGLDDTLLAGYSSGIHFRGKYFYHSIPVSPKNTFLTYGYSDSHSVPKQEFAPLGIKSDADSSSFSLHQEFYSAEAYMGEVFAGFDAKDKIIYTSGGVYNKDRQRMFSLGGTYVYRGSKDVATFSPQFYRGLSGFGASPKDNPFGSRGGQAKPIFSKLILELNYMRRLPWNLQASLKYRDQIAWQPLTPQEEFNLGGMDTVRGYPASDFLADNARVTNLEILSPAFFIPDSWRIPYAEDTLKNQTTLVGFFDWGVGDRKGTMFPGEKRKVDYMGVGAGVRFKFFNQAALRLEWAYQLGQKSLTESGKTQFHFAVNFQDQLPEEAERIRKIVEEQNIRRWAQELLDFELSRPDSPIKRKLDSYASLADAAYKEGRWQEARDYYQDVIQFSNSLLIQTEDYVRSCVRKEKELNNKLQLANRQYNEGRLSAAKETLSSVINEARLNEANIEY